MAKKAGVDAGNSRVKSFSELGPDMFLSGLGEYRDLKLKSMVGKDDMVYEYEGVKGFAGTLCDRESELGGSMMGNNKAHPDMLIRVLLALHRLTNKPEEEFDIVVGQPIKTHTDENKQKMKDMLIKDHPFTINGVKRIIRINRVEIGAECASAFWSAPKKGKIRIIDPGSGTTNIATVVDGVYIDRESDTFDFGLETVVSTDLDAFARKIAILCLKKWKRTDRVYIVGGKAEKLLIPLLYFFPNAEVLKPQLKVPVEDTNAIQIKLLPPIYANAVAFYEIAKKVYK